MPFVMACSTARRPASADALRHGAVVGGSIEVVTAAGTVDGDDVAGDDVDGAGVVRGIVVVVVVVVDVVVVVVVVVG